LQRVKELDGLRAIAIMVVLGCHFEGFAYRLHALPEFGWVGVDIFFALSGYLITTILLGLRGQPDPYLTFYSRRCIRIFPPYFTALLPVFVLGAISHHDFILKPPFVLTQIFFLQAFTPDYGRFFLDFITHVRWHLQHLPSLLSNAHQLRLAKTGAPAVTGSTSIYWSLSVEEYFYLLWAPVVLRCSRLAIVSIAAITCVAEMILRWSYPGYLSYFGIFFRFDGLLYGALLALVFERWKKMDSTPPIASKAIISCFWLATAGVCAIFAAIWPVIGREVRESPLMMVFGLPCLSLAAVSLIGLLLLRSNTNWWFARFLRISSVQFVGTISYTMYLVHPLIAYIVMTAAKPLGLVVHHGFLFGQAILDTILTIVVARLSWHYLEKPLLRWKDQRFPGVRVAEPKLD
jgi:peptidoglycan/LPS O-acetylase OafA/YrhL